MVDTIITCENGETIHLKLDTTLPRPYDREFTVRGTKGMYNQSLNMVYLDGTEEDYDTIGFNIKNINNAIAYEEKYLPSMWKNITDLERKKGHGGMDGFLFQAFVNAPRSNDGMPIDVYDAAAWMSISRLSAESIKNGNTSVLIPDFTNGSYKTRPRKDVINFNIK